LEICVIEPGITTLVKEVNWNAPVPNTAKGFSSVNDDNGHPENAESPKLVTLPGIVIEVNAQFEKA
jgi:hypothetical protein